MKKFCIVVVVLTFSHTHYNALSLIFPVSAAGQHLFLRSLSCGDVKGAAVCCCVFCHGCFLSLQLCSHSHTNVFHLILLIGPLPVTSSSSSSTIHSPLRRVLGRRLEKHHAVGLSKADRSLLAHLPVSSGGVTKVTLIAHQEPDEDDHRNKVAWLQNSDNYNTNSSTTAKVNARTNLDFWLRCSTFCFFIFFNISTF